MSKRASPPEPATGPTRLPDGVTVQAFDLDTDRDITVPAARALLSDEEAARAAAFAFAPDRARFERMRGLLRRSLGAATGQRPAHVPLAVEPFGKPYLAGSDLAFNLSHSGGLGLLAMSRIHQIGLDVELCDALDAAPDRASLARQILTPAECRALNGGGAEMSAPALLRCWTAKEALMKLGGDGLGRAPLDIELAFSGGRPVGYRGADSGVALHAGMTRDARALYALALTPKGVTPKGVPPKRRPTTP